MLIYVQRHVQHNDIEDDITSLSMVSGFWGSSPVRLSNLHLITFISPSGRQGRASPLTARPHEVSIQIGLAKLKANHLVCVDVCQRGVWKASGLGPSRCRNYCLLRGYPQT